ncbi:MAG: PstS family phosphate ABC transporter substrate-binding protein [Acidimicrobiales bacterium]
MRTKGRTIRLAGVVLAAALLAAACGDADGAVAREQSASESDETNNPGAVSGSIAITGSSTVEPIVALQAERFSQANPEIAISVSGPGSGDGAKAGCAGEVPIWNASRQMKDKEVEACQGNGVGFIELRRGIDGITVITSVNNNFVDCLSFPQLYALLSSESTGAATWSDTASLAQELGADASFFGDDPLAIFAPGEESGTYDSFIEIALEDVFESRVEAGAVGQDDFVVRPDYTASPNDNVIIDGVAGTDSSLGWVGFAFAKANADRVKALGVDGGEGCTPPNEATIASAEFPIARFLYTYVNLDAAQNDTAVRSFVDYMLSTEGLAAVEEVGYVSLDAAAIAATQEVWDSLDTGRQ